MPAVIRRQPHASVKILSLTDVEREAAQLCDDARRQAAALLERARHEADQVLEQRRAEAVAAGLAEGRRAGLEAARREADQIALAESRERLAALVQTLQAALDEYQRSKARLLAEAETGLIELALAIARRVCKRQADGDPAVAQANARCLLERVRNAGDLELRVSPVEYETLRTAVAEFLDAADRHEHVAVIADAAVSRGDCILRSRDGEIDARIDTQLDAVAAALLPGRREPAADPPTTHPTAANDGT